MEQEQTTTQEVETTNTPIVAQSSATQNATDDVSDHKLWAIVGYILPFLFFIPMLDQKTKNNAFARMHADQQLTMLAIWIVRAVFFNMFYMVIPFGFYMVSGVINLALFVLTIIGIVNAAQGKTKALPLIGGISLIHHLFGPKQ